MIVSSLAATQAWESASSSSFPHHQVALEEPILRMIIILWRWLNMHIKQQSQPIELLLLVFGYGQNLIVSLID